MPAKTTAIENNFEQMVSGARLCLERNIPMPALALLYALIDSVAWAVAPKEKNTRSRFESWVTQHILSKTPIACTATELYAARCAVLHTLTSTSDLHVRGQIRQVAYAWGTASVTTFNEVSVAINVSDRHVGVHIDELLNAVADGISATLEEARTNSVLAAALEQTASLHFAHMPRAMFESAKDQIVRRAP